MKKIVKNRIVKIDDVKNRDEADKIKSNALETYFNLFENGKYERACFGMGVGRLAHFLMESIKIIEI